MKGITFGLSAVIAIALYSGVLADENPVGRDIRDGQGRAEDMLAVAGDGGVNSGLFKQDDRGHGGATRGPGQFDGQAIHSEWGDVAFGSVGTNGDAGGDVVAGTGTGAQQVAGLPSKGGDVEGKGAVRGRGRVKNGENRFGGNGNGVVMDAMMPPRVEESGAVGRTEDGAVHVSYGGVRLPVIHGSSKMKEEIDVPSGLLDAESQVTHARHDQYRALDFPDMEDSPPKVVLGIKKNKSRMASALPAPLFGQGQQHISTTNAHGRQLQTTSWNQRGGNIFGEAGGDNFGYSVAISGNGSVLAVGAIRNDGNGFQSGSVRVYDWDGSNHVQRGGDIDGQAANDWSGWSLSISGDGSVLAIGARFNGGNGIQSGSVRVYDWDGTNHVQRGGDIDSEAAGDTFGSSVSISDDGGSSVSISGDGSVLAVGARFNDGNGTDSGSVRVYDWDGSNHVQRGGDINGEASGDRFGQSVAISDDGSVLAVGATGNDGNGTDSGSVRVYDWDGTNHVQRGGDINGEASGDQFGESVSISDDGSVLAVGAPNNAGNGTDSGSVRVYDWDGTNHVQRGGDINGEASEDLSGQSVAISYDGSVLAVGARFNDGNGPNSGSVRVYDWDGSNHVQRGDEINGEAAGDTFGRVSISDDGSVLAVGAEFNDGNGGNSGSATVYTWPVTTYGPWNINFLGLSANFSVNSNEELVLNYEIGKGRQFDTLLFMKDCATNVTDISINHTEPLLTPKMNANFSTLTLGYDIDKSIIASSSIWNATSSQIELCQVVQLKEGTLVITEDKCQVAIDFDLSVDYEISDIALGAETINAGNDTVDASSYIEACKCDGVSFVCNTDDLVPNLPLIVCIKSISPDLEIDFLESMNVTQGEDQDMAVVSNQVIVFTSFTSVEYVSAKNGVVVSTRVPTNVFDYNTVGSVIGINGGLVMKLPGSGRNLKTDIGAKLDASDEASFEIEVTLQRELAFVEETSLNSAANVATSKGVIGPVMLLAWANAMW